MNKKTPEVVRFVRLNLMQLHIFFFFIVIVFIVLVVVVVR